MVNNKKNLKKEKVVPKKIEEKEIVKDEEEKSNKKTLTIISSLVIVFIIVFIVGKSLSNPNSGYLKNQLVEGLSFENAEIIYEEGISTFTVEVYNENDTKVDLKTISINLKNADGDITTLVGYIGESLETQEGKLITASIDDDLTDSNNLEYIINK